MIFSFDTFVNTYDLIIIFNMILFLYHPPTSPLHDPRSFFTNPRYNTFEKNRKRLNSWCKNRLLFTGNVSMYTCNKQKEEGKKGRKKGGEKKGIKSRYEIFKNRNRCTRADNNCDNVRRISPGYCMQIEEHERYSRFSRKLHIRRVS